ncbi:Xylem cysteine proteinase 2 (fragment) [Parafrankia sp. Ea1.12]
MTLDDLANRAEKAHAEHLQGYTASTVKPKNHRITVPSSDRRPM